MEIYENNQQYHKEPLSVGQWVLTIFLLAIPIVNIVMLFVWAFGGNKDERENFAKASLIWMLIGIAITLVFWGCVGCVALSVL